MHFGTPPTVVGVICAIAVFRRNIIRKISKFLALSPCLLSMGQAIAREGGSDEETQREVVENRIVRLLYNPETGVMAE
ncbi:MAG: hypothetical protein ACSHW2_01100 [Parasphingopyxis sp.]